MFNRTTPGALRAVTPRILARAQAQDGTWLAVCETDFVTVRPGEEPTYAPWHLIRVGNWDRETMRLAWRTADEEHAATLESDAPDFVRAFHERVGASVVLSRVLDVPGGTVAVAVRKNLATREMFEQVEESRGVDLSDARVAAAVQAAREDLLDQVGLSL